MFKVERHASRVLRWSERNHVPWRRKRNKVLVAIALLATSLIVQRAPMAFARYNCISNPQTKSGNCYGIVSWFGTAGGIRSSITPVSMVPSPGNFWANNEEWLLDNSGGNWIEAGVTVGPTHDGHYCSSPCYFWADDRGGQYYEHYLGAVPDADYGNLTNIQIAFYPYDNSRWSINVTGASGDQYGDASTQNIMTPNETQVGMELYGYGGQSAAAASYFYNQWGDFSYPTQNWHYQTTDGQTLQMSPITAYWLVPPSLDNGQGGTWKTYCC